MAFSEARKAYKPELHALSDAIGQASDRVLKDILECAEIASDTNSESIRTRYDRAAGKLLREALEDFYREYHHDEYHDEPNPHCEECNPVVIEASDAFRRGE